MQQDLPCRMKCMLNILLFFPQNAFTAWVKPHKCVKDWWQIFTFYEYGISEQWAQRKEEIKEGTAKFVTLSEYDRYYFILITDDSISDYAC